MDAYVTKDGKKLRFGYTTGSCAAAAAKAAAWMLLSGNTRSTIQLLTPKGISLDLSVLEITRASDSVSCAIRKDAGDDPDITNGTLIFADVSLSDTMEIRIDGGKGVGRVTKPGLDQPVGEAAINSVPRRMIHENVEEICNLFNYHGGLNVIISVPEGEELAQRTFNPRLGITGGISILGTSGIVEPMSEKALTDTILLELRQRRLNGYEFVLLTPGNYGMNYLQEELKIDPQKPVMVSNFIGDSLEFCKELGFKGALLVGHIGKLVKIAGGMLNTHSRYGDCRMEIIASHAAACGLHSDLVREILGCATCDEAVRIMRTASVDEPVFEWLSEKIQENLNRKTEGAPNVETIVFSNKYSLLWQTEKARQVLRLIQEME